MCSPLVKIMTGCSSNWCFLGEPHGPPKHQAGYQEKIGIFHSLYQVHLLFAFQKTNIMIGTEQIRGLLNMSLVTGPATPRKVKAREVEQEKALLIPALLVPAGQAKKAKANAKVKTILKANPKVHITHAI